VDNIQYKFNKVYDKRTTAYSSFGHSSLYFNHEKFISLLTYKKIDNLIYSLVGRGKDSAKEVLKFLEKNHIDEELTDDLINDLRIVHGEALKLSIDIDSFEQIPLENIPIEIETYEADFNEKLEIAFDQMKKNHFKKFELIQELLDKYIEELLSNSDNGLKYSSMFLEKLLKKIVLFIEILDDEIERKYKKLKKNTFISQKKKKLNDLLGGFLSFLFKKSEIFSTRDEVISEINKNISYDIEIYSRELAIEIYEKFADHIEFIIKKTNSLNSNFEKLQTIIEEKSEFLRNKKITSPYITDIEILNRDSIIETIFDEIKFDDEKLINKMIYPNSNLLSLSNLETEELYEKFNEIIEKTIKNSEKSSLKYLVEKFNIIKNKMKDLTNGSSSYFKYSKVYSIRNKNISYHFLNFHKFFL
jgi:hypothetical protein